MKLVLDNNVIVSGIMDSESKPGKILAACIAGTYEWVSSEAMVEELQRVLQYPTVTKYITWKAAELMHFVESIRLRAILVDTWGVVAKVPGDPNDDMVLAALLASKADYLLTGDKELLKLADVHPILTPAAFFERFGS